ncbi:MAG: hypothetical protein EPO51_24195 [Phenylobacterium sp.]|uniref:hypothetical protein n=1 Tax=Phenylobacterium sp. TaxID=1871053 RepID=UPI001200D6F3|nr:hypothetical protein [Phenylobacterium sp.]TAJ69138.1 MAG: hypothetical protein EPO51_24195 [Phenylobacterium sp.]
MSVEPNAYIAVDVAADGHATLDTFTAPDDIAARRRALRVAEGVVLALWRDGELLGHWRREERGFTPADGPPPPARRRSS